MAHLSTTYDNNAEYQQLVHDVAQEISLCLDDEELAVRLAAIEALKLIKDTDANAAVVNLLHDQVPIVRAKAAESVGIEVNQTAVPKLVLLLADKNLALTLDETDWLLDSSLPLPVIRVCDFAFRALMHFNDETILLTLRQCLKETDPLLKAYVCHSIDKLEESSDREAFTDNLSILLFDTSPIMDEKVVTEAVEMIYKQFNERINVEINEEALKIFNEFADGFRRSAKTPICYHAVIALSTIGTPVAISRLLTAIDSPDPFMRALIIGVLGDWLCNFPDSGSHSRQKFLEIDPSLEKLRYEVVERLLLFLDDNAIVREDGENVCVCHIAAQTLALAGTEKAKLAVQQWQEKQ